MDDMILRVCFTTPPIPRLPTCAQVLNFIGLCTAPPCLIMEYCPRGSLYSVLRDARLLPSVAAELTWPTRLKVAIGAATGLHRR